MKVKFAKTALLQAISLALLGMAAGSALAESSAASAPESATQVAEDPAKSAASEAEEMKAEAEATDEPVPSELETITVTGFRRSIQLSTEAKRESVNFTDTIFSEDIGKFPDLNIAESLVRIPGVQISREVTGEGINVAIRGLGTNFTKILLNGSQIAVGSSGSTDSQNQNREVDLDLFPTELFNRLEVSKTPLASQAEGGVAGIVDMHTARPFDYSVDGVTTYQFQGGYSESGSNFSPRGAATTSWINDSETFGILFGAAAASNKVTVEGFETIGWTNPGLTYTQCGLTPPAGTPATNQPASCNVGGGGNWRIPDTVPNGAGLGLVPTTVIDNAYLRGLNPGLDTNQLSEALIPRLGRPSYIDGDRDRISGLLSLEYRPSEAANFYLDVLYSDANREFDRLDVNWVGRFGNAIPVGIQVDSNNVVTSGSFANSQFFLEARPYTENVDFLNFNPGGRFTFGDDWVLDVQGNWSESDFERESPTVLINTPLGQGTVVEYTNSGDFPDIATNVDLNDPNLGWTWTGGRLNIQKERRKVENKGVRGDLRFGDDQNNLRFGMAYDDISRDIRGYDNSAAWENVACRGLNPDGTVPNPRPACVGGSLAAIPQSVLNSYLSSGPGGFITVDFERFFADTNYHALASAAPESNSSNTGAATGSIGEENLGAYVEANGEMEIMGRRLRANAGVRFVSTDQEISGPVTIAGVRQFQSLYSDYDEFLPSFNTAWDVQEDMVVRLSSSRTLTRPNPSVMLPNTNFSDPSAQTATQGNPNLAPYLSTNVDLGFEWYTGDEGVVAITGFNKRLTGFTVNGTNTIPFLQLGIPFDSLTEIQQGSINQRGGPDNATVTVQQQVNAEGSLEITGYELIWVQPLDRLIEGLGFSANYTDIDQESRGSGVPAVAVGVSPRSYNLTGYWENHGASIRLAYVWNDEQIISGSNQNGIPTASLRADDRGQLDLSAGYTFEDWWSRPQITLNVINITGEPLRTTFAYDNATFTYYDPGYTILLGFRGTF